MQQEYFNRYSRFVENGKYKTLPFITLEPKSTDIPEVYIKNQSRLDAFSQQYYDNPTYGWLILLANPHFASLEFSLPDRIEIRIPYPLEPTLQEYTSKVKKFETLYGN